MAIHRWRKLKSLFHLSSAYLASPLALPGCYTGAVLSASKIHGFPEREMALFWGADLALRSRYRNIALLIVSPLWFCKCFPLTTTLNCVKKGLEGSRLLNGSLANSLCDLMIFLHYVFINFFMVTYNSTKAWYTWRIEVSFSSPTLRAIVISNGGKSAYFIDSDTVAYPFQPFFQRRPNDQ